jgi:hypothetical protein
VDWDPFQDVDRGEDDDPVLLRERAIARARTLDPKVAVCAGCHVPSEDWIARRGLTGDGVCRACMALRESERAGARAFTRRFHEALERLWGLRKERDAKIAKEIADVPF